MRLLVLSLLVGTLVSSGCASSRWAMGGPAGAAGSAGAPGPYPPPPPPAPVIPPPVDPPVSYVPVPSPPPPPARPDTLAVTPTHPAPPRNGGGTPPSRPKRGGAPRSGGNGASTASEDSVRVQGDTLLTEGVVYAFTLELAKKTALPARRADSAPVIVQEAVPTFGDSARACLQGEGFTIVLAGAPAGETCSVKRLADEAQRLWTWTVRADTVTRAHGQNQASRRLIFSVASYGHSRRADFERAYPVTVRIVPPTWFERLMTVATSTKGLLVELVAIAAAIAALVKYARRKRSEVAAER